jgi:hypothetical protein
MPTRPSCKIAKKLAMVTMSQIAASIESRSVDASANKRGGRTRCEIDDKHTVGEADKLVGIVSQSATERHESTPELAPRLGPELRSVLRDGSRRLKVLGGSRRELEVLVEDWDGVLGNAHDRLGRGEDDETAARNQYVR